MFNRRMFCVQLDRIYEQGGIFKGKSKVQEKLLKIRGKHLKSLEHLITKECQKNLTLTGYIEWNSEKENSENILRHMMRKSGLENLILKGCIALREGLEDKKVEQINL